MDTCMHVHTPTHTHAYQDITQAQTRTQTHTFTSTHIQNTHADIRTHTHHGIQLCCLTRINKLCTRVHVITIHKPGLFIWTELKCTDHQKPSLLVSLGALQHPYVQFLRTSDTEIGPQGQPNPERPPCSLLP